MFFLCICIVYVRYVLLRVAVFFLTQNRHLLSTSVTCHAGGFPMFLHCIRSLHFLKDVSDFFFFLIQFSCNYLSTFVTCHGMFFLCICIVYIRNVFLKIY